MHKISAVVLTRNEEESIAKCLKSLEFCDEVLVIDDNSQDQTLNIVKKFNAKVIKHSLNGNFAGQRNFALKKTKNDWVLFVDADEVVTKDLAEEIKKAVNTKKYNGFFIKRSDNWLGKKLKYGEFGESCLIRLANKNKGKWVRSVHEHWLVEENVSTLKNHLLHYPHPNITNFIDQINFQSHLHARANLTENKKFNYLNVIFYPLGKFFVNYIVKKGYKDGTHGFVAATLMSFHSFLAWSQAWTEKK